MTFDMRHFSDFPCDGKCQSRVVPSACMKTSLVLTPMCDIIKQIVQMPTHSPTKQTIMYYSKHTNTHTHTQTERKQGGMSYIHEQTKQDESKYSHPSTDCGNIYIHAALPTLLTALLKGK